MFKSFTAQRMPCIPGMGDGLGGGSMCAAGPGDCSGDSWPARYPSNSEGRIFLRSVCTHGNPVSVSRFINSSKTPSKRSAPTPGHRLL